MKLSPPPGVAIPAEVTFFPFVSDLIDHAAPQVVTADVDGVAIDLVRSSFGGEESTRAAGLVVAVPAVLLYNHFARKMSVMLTVAEMHARSINSVANELADVEPGTSESKPTVERIRAAITEPAVS